MEFIVRQVNGTCMDKINKHANLFLVFALLTTFASSVSFAAELTQTISLADALNIALNNNPRMSISKAKLAAASASITETRGSGFPKVAWEVNGSHSNNPLTVFANKLAQGNASFGDFGANHYTGPSTLNVKPAALDNPGYYTNWNTAVVLNIPLFSGGGDTARLKKAETLLKAAQLGDQQAKTELSYDILQAYEGVHAAKQLVEIAKDALSAADRYVILTKNLAKQSAVTNSDVTMAENYQRSARSALMAAKVEEQNQIDSFRVLIGKQNSSYVPGHSVVLFIPGSSLLTLQHRAMLTNSQLQLLKSNVEASRADIKSASANHWPKLNLQLRHDWNAQRVALAGASNTAMLSMDWELFSSGQQIGSERQAVAQYDQAQAELDNASSTISLAISQSLRAIRLANTQFETSKLNAAQSIYIVDDSKRRYGQGLIPLGQLLDTQARLDNAKAQEVTAKYNLLLAKARLLGLIDELIPTLEKLS